MSIPQPDQTTHLMNWCDVLRVRHAISGRNKLELKLYTTDNLRQRYQECSDNLIRLQDGILTRVELVAEIRWRIFWARFGYGILLFTAVIGTVAAVIAAVEGWK